MTSVLHFQPKPPTPFSMSKVFLWGLFKYWKYPDSINVLKVKMIDKLASYTSNCNFNVKCYNRPSVLRMPFGLNRWKWKFLNFVRFAYNMPWLSLFHDFDLSFLRHLQDKVYLLFVHFFKKHLQPIPHF